MASQFAKIAAFILTLPMMAQAQVTDLDSLRRFDHRRDTSYYRQRCIVSNRAPYEQQLFLNNPMNRNAIAKAGVSVNGQPRLNELGFSENSIQFTGDITADAALLNNHKQMMQSQKEAYQGMMGNTSHRMWHLFWHCSSSMSYYNAIFNRACTGSIEDASKHK